MLKLQFRDRRQESVWLVDDEFSIGSDAENSLVIKTGDVHGKHAEILQTTSGQLFIKDLGSPSGTYLNGNRVNADTEINAGDVLKLGEVELEVIDPKMAVASPPTVARAAVEWKVIATASWMNGQIFEVKNTMTIGRDSSCDISIPVEHLSRKHAELTLQDGKLFVTDLGSSNGTFVNGNRVTRIELHPGDKLKFDVVTFSIDGPAQEEAPDPNKTIIRPAIKINPEDLPKREPKAKPANTGDQTVPRAAPLKKPAGKSPKPYDWVTEEEQPKSEGTPMASILSILAAVIVVAGLAAMFLL